MLYHSLLAPRDRVIVGDAEHERLLAGKQCHGAVVVSGTWSAGMPINAKEVSSTRRISVLTNQSPATAGAVASTLTCTDSPGSSPSGTAAWPNRGPGSGDPSASGAGAT